VGSCHGPKPAHWGHEPKTGNPKIWDGQRFPSPSLSAPDLWVLIGRFMESRHGPQAAHWNHDRLSPADSGRPADGGVQSVGLPESAGGSWREPTARQMPRFRPLNLPAVSPWKSRWVPGGSWVATRARKPRIGTMNPEKARAGKLLAGKFLSQFSCPQSSCQLPGSWREPTARQLPRFRPLNLPAVSHWKSREVPGGSWVGWVASVVLAPALYVLSTGPVWWLQEHEYLPKPVRPAVAPAGQRPVGDFGLHGVVGFGA